MESDDTDAQAEADQRWSNEAADRIARELRACEMLGPRGSAAGVRELIAHQLFHFLYEQRQKAIDQ